MARPRGCRFTPNDFELIQYLSDKINGRPDPGQGFINNHVDVYGTSPHLLPLGARDEKLFCFTPIKFRKEPTCRDRSTPHGYWKAKNGKNTVRDDDGNPVGFTQNFTYYLGKMRGFRTKWIMKEYTIFDGEPHNVALCVIYFSVNKYSPRPIEKFSILPSEADVSNIKSSQGPRCDNTESHDMIKDKYVTSPSYFHASLLEEVNSPQLDLKL
ncbi:putative transcription factor NAM family [Dioscorea sansibarensis]